MNTLKFKGQNVINLLKEFIAFAEEYNLTNEQDFLNIVDKINELSVMY